MKRRILIAAAALTAGLAVPATASASIAWTSAPQSIAWTARPMPLPPQPSPIKGRACMRIIWITVCTPYTAVPR